MKEPFQKTEIQPENAKVAKAISLIEYLLSSSNPFARFLKCYQLPDKMEAVDFELDIEVNQLRVFDIQPKEHMRVVFDSIDVHQPEVFAMRQNFPRVPHTNLRIFKYPISLCLYDQDYSEIKLFWSPPVFIERIRWWLAKTASGELHGQDQPLEPLIGNSSLCALPASLLGAESEEITLIGNKIRENNYFYAARPPISDDEERITFLHLSVQGKPQTHGVIAHSPLNLKELAELLIVCEIDIVQQLEQKIERWIDSEKRNKNAEFLNRKLAIQVILPKMRKDGAQVENIDYFFFVTLISVKEIACKLGRWQMLGAELATIVDENIDRDLEGVQIATFSLLPLLTPKGAAHQSGDNFQSPKLVLIGSGALGSQLFMNCVKSGFGEWTIIDKDQLFPHNLARHALDIRYLGLYKASALAAQAKHVLWEDFEPTAINADIHNPKGEDKEIKDRLGACDVVVDCSASQSVLKHLAVNTSSSARRISCFLNPSGEHLVFLAEDHTRKNRLDSLEMQYLRVVTNDPYLNQHFKVSGDRIRYGNGCSDVNFQISTELVSIFSGLASKALKQQLMRDSATINLFMYNDTNLSVESRNIPVAETIIQNINGWEIILDQHFLDKVFKSRFQQLPNETGGVLIGAIDLQRKQIFIVDTLETPSDSKQYPTCFIRGSNGLKDEVMQVKKLSGGTLSYIGEWHSHPNNVDVTPSADDQKVLDWIYESMHTEGLPGLIMIAGDNEKIHFKLKE